MASDTYNNHQSAVIDWLRFSMAVAIVVLHADRSLENPSLPIYTTLCILFPQGICRVAVPCFFLISGYLFFRNLESWDFGIWKGKMVRRVHSLLIPYVLWNILAAILIMGYQYLRSHFGSMEAADFVNTPSQWGWLNIFWSVNNTGMPLDYPLWFIRDLIIYTVATPLIYMLCRYLKGAGIIALAVLLFVFADTQKGLWFYTFGAWLSIGRKDLVQSFYPWRWPAAIVFLVVLCVLPYTYRTQVSLYQHLLDLLTISGCVCALMIASTGIKQGFFHVHPFLTRSSFFIFAAHGILILDDFARFIMLHITSSRSDLYFCCDLLFRPIIAVLICLGLYYILNRCIPRFTSILTGAR